jgi:Flp pilus assembly protein TadD
LLNGDTGKASTYFSKASALNPKDVPKRTALALTQIASGDTATAFQDLETLAAQDTGTTADMALISAHLRRKEFDKALKAVDALEKKQAGSPAPYHLRGSILLARQDIPCARKSYEQA